MSLLNGGGDECSVDLPGLGGLCSVFFLISQGDKGEKREVQVYCSLTFSLQWPQAREEGQPQSWRSWLYHQVLPKGCCCDLSNSRIRRGVPLVFSRFDCFLKSHVWQCFPNLWYSRREYYHAPPGGWLPALPAWSPYTLCQLLSSPYL